MILHPAILVLILVSCIITGMIIYASYFGVQIIRQWDIRSGSEQQLILERKTYLISFLLSYVFAFQIGSLFLFVFTADNLHNLFVGAMCAAGTLNVDTYGYPTFLLKIVNCIMAGLWLILNYVDNRAHDYPLIKKKYAMLLLVTPYIGIETVVQTTYFLGLKEDVITSCCGSLFNPGKNTVAADIAAFPPVPAMLSFYGSMAITLGAGVLYRTKGMFTRLFSFSSGITFLVSSAAFVSFITLYFYEIPTHHCPFCILQREYGYIGYVFYTTLLTGVVSGLGIGLLSPFRDIQSLRMIIPEVQKRLTTVCLASYGLFMAVFIVRMLSTPFILGS